MEYRYNLKKVYWLAGVLLILITLTILYSAGVFKNINQSKISSIISYISENAHTGLDKSPGAQIAFGERPETANQYAIVIPKKTETGRPAEENQVAVGEQSRQLFDINLEVDSLSVDSVNDLGLRVVFISFGTVPTPIDMTFDILDSSGAAVYSKTENITVETEAVYNKSFVGLDLSPGEYVLRLTTLYNTGVEDKFEQSFEIKSAFNWVRFRLYMTGIIGIIIILLLVFPKKFYLKKQNKNSPEIEINKTI